MSELIIFGDVEDTLCTWLTAQLAANDVAVSVSTRVPTPRPSSFVRVLRQGGVVHTLVTDAATVSVECFGDDESSAVTLAQLARALIRSMPTRVDGIVRVDEASGPANFPDPLTAQTRYSQTFVIHQRGSSVPITTGDRS